MEKPVILLNYEHYYIIGSTDFCKSSKMTFTMEADRLALSKPILDALPLVHLGHKSDEEQINFFAHYLAAFRPDEEQERIKWLKSNPTLRILILDNDIKIKLLMVGVEFDE